jgi:hypothetical protein
MQSVGLDNEKEVSYFQYDFSRNGGAVGAITVYGNPIPAGAIIDRGKIQVKAAVASGGMATVAITAQSAGDILASTAQASLTLNALLDPTPDGTAAKSILVTNNITALKFTVGTAALTAGVVLVALEYYMAPDL